MSRIVLVSESGSDITPELASKYGIRVVPMHVNFGDENLNDGSFPVQRIIDFYELTGLLPKTSGSTVEDFEKAFEEIHVKWPEAEVLYLATSSAVTDSFKNAMQAAANKDYVHTIDTRQVSIGQLAIIIEIARFIQENPDRTIYEVVKYAEELSEMTKMCFVPDKLEFLRAGGRVSNHVFWKASILGMHPCIEMEEGKLCVTKKYYGKIPKVAARLFRDYAENYHLKKDRVWLVYTIGLAEETRNSIEDAAWSQGFEQLQWVQAKGVITTHGGPAAFGVAGFTSE